MAAKNPGLPQNNRLILGISGASGVAYGVRALELLKAAGIEAHLVMTKAAEMTLGYETGLKAADVEKLAHTRYRIEDIGAGIASGSFRTMGMIVAPCSIRTMSEIATGVTSSLLTRAADVVLKERRRLVLMVHDDSAVRNRRNHRTTRARPLRKARKRRRSGDANSGPGA